MPALAILIFYSPKRVQEAFFSQILTVYSLLLTCIIAIIRSDLTRFHAFVVLALVLSPVTVYFVAYSIRSFWSTKHRLDNLLGRSNYLRRALVLAAAVAWLAIFIFAYLPNANERFSQASCKGRSVMESFYLIVPFIYMQAFVELGIAFPVVLFVLPIVLLIIAWIVAIFLRRKEIWPPGEPYRPRFLKVWSVDSARGRALILIKRYRRTIGYYYPFVQFMSVVAFPMAYWVTVVELCIFGTMDNTFSLSFGQVCFHVRNINERRLTSPRSSRYSLPSLRSSRCYLSSVGCGGGSGKPPWPRAS